MLMAEYAHAGSEIRAKKYTKSTLYNEEKNRTSRLRNFDV